MLNLILHSKKTAAERREEMLSAYLDGELSPRERADLEHTLTRDAELRAELEELHQVVGLMKAVPPAPLPRSFALDPAVYGRVRQPWLQLYPALRAATVLATAVLVFLFAGDLFLNLSGGAGLPAQTAPEWQVAEVVETREVEIESENVAVTLAAEAPAAKQAAGAVPEEAAEVAPEEAAALSADAESQAADVARELGTEAVVEEPAAPVDPPAAVPLPEGTLALEVEGADEAPAEEGVAALMVAPTMTLEMHEAAPFTPSEEVATAEAYVYGLPTPTAAQETVEEDEAVRAGKERTGGTNWVLITEISLAALAGALLVLTLLARRHGW